VAGRAHAAASGRLKAQDGPGAAGRRRGRGRGQGWPRCARGCAPGYEPGL